MDATALAARIDQTLLDPAVGPEAGAEWVAANCTLGFAALCVAPFLVPTAAKHLAETDTAVCSVVGFPLGYATTAAKAAEASDLVSLGCAEIDVVINVGALLEGDDEYVLRDLAAVVDAVGEASGGSAIVKAILETGRLAPTDIPRACSIALAAGAAFVKTSTGFGPRGASVEDVRIMREAVGERAGVKAAGGIRDLASALAMLDAGATRIGTSAGVAILGEAREQAQAGTRGLTADD